jgi:hypothetical protein
MGNEVKSEPHLMLVIVLLILSASAIAMPPSKVMLCSKLQSEGVTKLNDQNAVINAQQNVKGGNVGRRALLDSSDRFVDIEHLGNRHTTLRAEFVFFPNWKWGADDQNGVIGDK